MHHGNNRRTQGPGSFTALASLGAAALITLTPGPRAARAAEGMFLLHGLPADKLVRSGLKIAPARLGALSRAVVQIARGGTGSFVSDRGLVVTNHHVAYGCMARLGAGKAHQGLLDRGYLAQKLKDELSCPGYDMLVVSRVQDVTPQVAGSVPPRAHWSKRFELIRQKKEKLIKACEADKKHVCEIAAMDGGRSYLMSVYTRVRDVRLVYAPPRSLGKYGGDIDNWMYPRHTADFTFLRAYVDAGGAGKPYAATNRPLSTPVFLKISPHGVRRGSLSMVVGFPGRTSRHVTSHQVKFYAELEVPSAVALFDGLASVLKARMKASADSRRKYVHLDAKIQNALKYYRMSGDGVRRWKVLQRKLAEEKALLAGSGKRRAGLQKLLKQIGAIFARYEGYREKRTILRRLKSQLVMSVQAAHDIVKWGKEKAKPDLMRKDRRYKTKNTYQFIEAVQRLDGEIDLQTEKALLTFFLRRAAKLPARRRPRIVAGLSRWARKELGKARAAARKKKTDLGAHFLESYGVKMSSDELERAVDMMYGKTRVLAKSGAPAERARAKKLRAALLAEDEKALARSDDPLLRFARDVMAEFDGIEEGPHREVTQRLKTVLHPRWVKEGKRPSYPDANFTVRLTLGSVRDYVASATGKKHRYMTSLAGLLAKDRGAFPFEVPGRLKAAFPRRAGSRYVDRSIKDIPVNFTTTVDTTGGNSGSPVLDDRGRLVGLLFDGTPESILSDWQYLGREQRSICMDIRLALYLAEVAGARRLLGELGQGERKGRAIRAPAAAR